MDYRRELIRTYQQSDVKAGLFQIANLSNGKSYLNSTMELDSAFMDDITQLEHGIHSCAELQNDWNNMGEEVFSYRILIEIPTQHILTITEIKEVLNKRLHNCKSDFTKVGKALYCI